MAATTIGTLSVKLSANAWDFQKGIAAARAATKQYERDSIAMFNATRTEGEKFAAKMQQITALASKGLIDNKTASRAMTAARADYQQMLDVQRRASPAGQAAAAAQRQHNQAMQEGSAVFRATRTSAEQYAAEVARLSSLHRQGAVSAGTYTRGIMQARNAYMQQFAASQAGGGRGGLGAIASRLSPQLGMLSGLGAGGAAAVGGGLFLGMGVKLASDMEKATISFKTMLGSAEDAKRVLADLRTFADATPFEFPELRDAARNLVAFGFSANEIIPLMKRLGDVSSGLNVPIGEIAEVYGKAKVQGRAFARDIHELTNRGVPIIQELAKQFGVADDEVMKLVEHGKVGFKQIEQAFKSLTGEGSKFGGLTQELSTTLGGRFSTAVDNVKALALWLGESAAKLVLLNQGLAAFNATSDFLRDAKTGIGIWMHGEDEQGTRWRHTTFAEREAAARADLARRRAATQAATQRPSAWGTGPTADAVRSQREQYEADNKRAADDYQSMIRELGTRRIELEHYGESAEKVRLRVMGLTEAEMALPLAIIAGNEALEARHKAVEKQKEDAKALFDSTRTPREQFESKLRGIASLLNVGAIDLKTANRAGAAALHDFASSQPQNKGEVQALVQGSREAISFQRSFLAKADTDKNIKQQALQIIAEISRDIKNGVNLSLAQF